jgi:hypothetical protein
MPDRSLATFGRILTITRNVRAESSGSALSFFHVQPIAPAINLSIRADRGQSIDAQPNRRACLSGAFVVEGSHYAKARKGFRWKD